MTSLNTLPRLSTAPQKSPSLQNSDPSRAWDTPIAVTFDVNYRPLFHEKSSSIIFVVLNVFKLHKFTMSRASTCLNAALNSFPSLFVQFNLSDIVNRSAWCCAQLSCGDAESDVGDVGVEAAAETRRLWLPGADTILANCTNSVILTMWDS